MTRQPSPPDLRHAGLFRLATVPLWLGVVVTSVLLLAIHPGLPWGTSSEELPAYVDPEIVAGLRLAEEIERDVRIPKESDLGGVWGSGPNLVGFTIQLEDRNTTLSGRGYYWGCLGVYDPISVQGSRSGDDISLTLTSEGRSTREFRLRYVEVDGYPRLESVPRTDDPNMDLITSHELRQRRARGE